MLAWAVIFNFSIEWFAFQEMQNIGTIVSGPSPVCPDTGDPGKGIHKQGAVRGWSWLVAHCIPAVGAASCGPLSLMFLVVLMGQPFHPPQQGESAASIWDGHGHAGLQKGAKHKAED